MERAEQQLQFVAEVHLEVLFPKRRFTVELYRDERKMGTLVVARFENHHGPQRVGQIWHDDYSQEINHTRNFRWSDVSITQMMLLE